MNRRFFLQGTGGVVLAAPFLGSLVERTAHAQAATPVRNIIFFTHNGCNTNEWFPADDNGPITADNLSPTLSPLADVAHKLLFPRGIRSNNGYGSFQTIDPHNQAMGSKLTCATIDENDNYATDISIDHEIARQLNPNGASPLILSVGQRSTSIKEVVSFSGPSEAYVSEVNPSVVYNQLTSSLTNAVSGGGMTAPVTEADYGVLRGKSAMDYVRNDLLSYQALNMSTADRQRIDAWMALLRDTEAGVVSLATGSCSTGFATDLGVTDTSVADAGTGVSGTRSGSFVFGQQGSDALNQSFTVGGDMMLNLIALSAICDTNRSMGMVYPGYVTFNWDGISHNADHHGLSHRSGDLQVFADCIAGVMAMIAEIDNWYAGKYAKLVKLLDSIPEGDKTVLDNSAVVWIPELSDGNAHNLNNLPIVISGSAGGKLKQGQAVAVATNTGGQGNSSNTCQSGQAGEANGNSASNGGDTPINKLYCTLFNAYGMTAPGGGEWSEWGQFDSERGPSSGITDAGQLDDLLA
jgi:hypothetical protein